MLAQHKNSSRNTQYMGNSVAELHSVVFSGPEGESNLDDIWD